MNVSRIVFTFTSIAVGMWNGFPVAHAARCKQPSACANGCQPFSPHT